MRHELNPTARPEGFPDLFNGARVADIGPGPWVHTRDLHERHHFLPGLVVWQLRHDLDCEFFHHHAVPHPHTPV
ncbi:hypothetical protein ACFWP7_31910 [Streptomyces sp. NPDC058470]|uniref:hypothetical protein n=1 Tax=Streptomyces sp. NPDC058470 TaxID=3346515 RepID=UPI00364A1510